jgi:octaprenyl-diphosphate synthase
MVTDTATSNNSKQTIKEINDLMSDDMKAFYRHYRKGLRSGVFVIDQVAAYLIRSRGKGLRALLTLLCSRAAGLEGPLPEKTLSGALIVEMLHTATLVHDDVVDQADERRGRPTLNIVFNNKVAVLFGDFMLSRSLAAMLAQRRFEVLDLFTDCSLRLAKGELVEAIGSRKLDLDKNKYFQMVSDKTASLISAACQMGALSIDKTEYSDAFRRYGEMLGIAFQIRDDLLDFGVGGSYIGKPMGLDLSQAKLTLPLIHTLENVSPYLRGRVLYKLRKAKRAGKKGRVVDLKDVIDLIRQNGGIAYSDRVAHDYADKAVQAIREVPDSIYKKSLVKFARYAVERNK